MAHQGGICYCGCRGPGGERGSVEAEQAYAKWTASDETTLQKLFLGGTPVPRIAELLGREPGAIRARLRRLGLME